MYFRYHIEITSSFYLHFLEFGIFYINNCSTEITNFLDGNYHQVEYFLALDLDEQFSIYEGKSYQMQFQLKLNASFIYNCFFFLYLIATLLLIIHFFVDYYLVVDLYCVVHYHFVDLCFFLNLVFLL